ncbi:MAG: A/G-specific adenine glycosylase, partial [Lachnospiraceae bacterium]|nr:A/G-specific adenine glycosylase [Lachnospiraceae bacterium]
ALAAAKEDVLLKIWQGLGYYSRARNLQKAAKEVCERFNGIMPASYEELIRLPGIGPYTAGAIASIAFKIPVPAVDGNVYRVLARLRADEREIDLPSTARDIRQELLEIIPKEDPGIFNQALMEIGALVCIPNAEPKCRECPVSACCRAFKEGKQREYPKKGAKKPPRVSEKTVLLIRDGEKTALRKRTRKGLLSGMYEFPTLDGHLDQREVLEYLERIGLASVRIEPLPESKYVFTSLEWRMIGYLIQIDELEKRDFQGEGADLLFVERKEAEEHYPIPTAFAAYAKFLEKR